jgi:hypothetical protein
MIDLDGKLINPAHIISAEVETRHYMNGSVSYLVVKLVDGSLISHEHGWGFDAWATLDKIKGLQS